MVGFTFSAEQIKQAPPDVRRWLEAEIVKALTGAPPAAAEAANPEVSDRLERALAAGTAKEMEDVFSRVSNNAIVARVFFELARETSLAGGASPFHVVNLVDMMRHLQLADAQQVFACLDAINQAFRQVRREPQASLFALDEAGHIYLHDLTYHAIRQVWQQLVLAHPWPASGHMAQAPVTGVAPSPVGRQEPTLEPVIRPEHAFGGTAEQGPLA